MGQRTPPRWVEGAVGAKGEGALEGVGRDGRLEGDLGRRDDGSEEGEGEVDEGGGLGGGEQRCNLGLLEEMGGGLDGGKEGEGGDGKGRRGGDRDLQCSWRSCGQYPGSKEEREEAVEDLAVDVLRDEVLERYGGELVASDLALEGPEVDVDGEDTVTEEPVEDSVVVGALDLVGEVGGEGVLEVEGVGGTGPVGEAEEGVDSGPSGGPATAGVEICLAVTVS